MTTLILRQGIGGKGSPLTMTELDSNFINLNADKVEVADAVSTNSVNKVVRRDAAGNFSAGTITADLDGNATSADKLSTARTISLSGDATGFATFDGSSNAIIDVTLTSNSVELGVGTTGNYVASVSTTAPLVGGSLGSESAALTIALNSGYGDIQNPYEAKTAKTFLAAPNAATGLPTFRAILASDIPTLNQNTTGTASNVTGTVAVENGGTGSTTPSGARTNLGLGNLATLNAVGNAQINDGVVTFAKFAQSEWSSVKQTFGYQKLPSGLIMQWGYVITGTNGQATWTFPVAFPNRVLKIVTGCANAVFAIVNTDPSTTTTQQVYTTDANSTPVSNIAVALLAIGH